MEEQCQDIQMDSSLIDEDMLRQHGLSREDHSRIVSLLGRVPNLNEIGIFSVMWSEHCSYGSSKRYLKQLPSDGDRVLQGPGENAGIVDVGEGLALVFKMESHNHPSYIEPYQGAATGVGGILRDIFTMGARPIAILDSLRFGELGHPMTRYLLKGVVTGIAGYGNCMGVPTVGGEVYFHHSYNGNCLVNAMAVGIVKKERIFRGTAAGVGNPVVYCGSKTGRDGIHGATMASDVFGDGGEERRPTVQVGDPFTEKLLLEACLEVFRTEYIVGVQDMGAAGLTSSSVEMAGRGGCGMEIDISLVPKREEGMTPYEVMLSESQERMLFVVKKGCEMKVASIFRKWGLDSVVIGTVTDDGKLRLKEGCRVVAEIPVKALIEESPEYDRIVTKPSWQEEIVALNTREIDEPDNLDSTLITLLSSMNLCSRKWVFRQYDHMVRTDTVVLPGSDAAVIRIKGTQKAVAMTADCNSRYCFLDPRAGSAIAVAEAARNLVSVGAEPLAVTDCLNFGNPERPEIMWQFKKSVEGIRDACLGFGLPVVSGNVSLYNETSEESVYPTPTIGMVGLIDNIEFHVTHEFKEKGDIIVLLGETREELGGSEYLALIHGIERGMPPVLDTRLEKSIHRCCLEAIRAGILKSAHDCSDGGLAVALAESCISHEGGIGAVIHNYQIQGNIRNDAFLFGETQSRIIVSLSEKELAPLFKLAEESSVHAAVIGTVGGNRLVINELIDLPISELGRVYERRFEKEFT